MKVSVGNFLEDLLIPPHPCGTLGMREHVGRFDFLFGWFADNCNGSPEKQRLEMPERELH